MTKFQFEVGKTYQYITIERRTRCYVWINGWKTKVYTQKFDSYETEYILFGMQPGTMCMKRVYCN